MDGPINIPLSDRVRLVGYGLIAGIVLGAFLGWWFHSWVGFIVRLFFVAMFLVPLVAAIYFWRRVTTTPAQQSSNVREAEWAELDTTSRPRG
jgi:F0F1-type ATP synthase assembly protein I